MLNDLNTSKAKKIRKAIKGERGYLLGLVYIDARKRKPWFMPTFVFDAFYDNLFLGKAERKAISNNKQ